MRKPAFCICGNKGAVLVCVRPVWKPQRQVSSRCGSSKLVSEQILKMLIRNQNQAFVSFSIKVYYVVDAH